MLTRMEGDAVKEPPWITALLDRPYTPTASRLVDWYLLQMDEKYHRQKQRHHPNQGQSTSVKPRTIAVRKRI
ncbi:hypothetical protein LQF76_10090 [Gloeomargaritales cyanobacterium VI4D9]|nr:hypothetical protein LQF76_10090 [Gloeomargaritales cyanobacterium VI4D9]